MNLLLDLERMVTSLLVNKNHHHEHNHNHHEDDTNSRVGMKLEVQNIKITIYGDIQMSFTLKDSELTTLHATAIDATGIEVVSTPLTWVSSDDTVVALTVAVDSRSAVATSTGKVGTATVTVTSGSITATFDITVAAGDVASITLTADPASSRLVTPAPVAAAAPVDTTVAPAVVDPNAAPVAPVV